jgi:hypothetical protein
VYWKEYPHLKNKFTKGNLKEKIKKRARVRCKLKRAIIEKEETYGELD